MKYDFFKKEREQATEHASGIKFLNRTTSAGQPAIMIWRPKASKPHANYRFNTEQQRTEYLEKEAAQFLEHKARVNQWKEARKPKTDLINTLKKGDLFFTSWGYDQTNYDYLVVLSVSATGKTATCQMTSALHMGTSGQANVQEPIYCPYGDTFQMKVQSNYKGDEIMLKGSYPYCVSGRKENMRLDSFMPVAAGQQFQETMAEFGH